MREIIEFRIPEPEANMLPGNPGRSLGIVRNVRLPLEDERVRLIGELDREFKKRGRSFFLGWSISRHYTSEELQSAELFALRPRSIFEPCGEMCGTEYDESEACSLCGAGARQSTDLHLDPESIPKRDLSFTIAREIVVSSRLAQALQAHGTTGAAFLPVRDPTGKLLDDWRQLTITSAPVDIVPPTLIGNTLFDLDEQGKFRCPQGHVLGLGLLSETWIRRGSYDGSDLVRTRQLTGLRRGVLHPQPVILFSTKLYRLLRELKVGRLVVEVAHLT
ncbi:hypothetical protein F0U61_33090 [Archangium violaceum]|uniref:hypothetical protein n=1 Tax=Archangium violaceum TaxID=83451 RepID=UPI002B2EFC81|nr:hypothetical protein F0U61_33090 [Archangium violaceum]